MEGKPRLKARRRKHREERDGYRAFSSERRQFIIIFFFLFSTGCAFRPAASYEYGNARRPACSPLDFCCIHLRPAGSVLCLWFCRYHASDTWLHSLRCARVERLHGRLSTHDITFITEDFAEMVLSYHLICFYDSRISVITFKRVIISLRVLE